MVAARQLVWHDPPEKIYFITLNCDFLSCGAMDAHYCFILNDERITSCLGVPFYRRATRLHTVSMLATALDVQTEALIVTFSDISIMIMICISGSNAQLQ